MLDSSLLRRCRRLSTALGLAAALLVAPRAGQAQTSLALWAEHDLKIAGSDNVFCGWAHSNGTASVTGSDNAVSGRLEYVEDLQASPHNELNPVQTPAASMPTPPHDLAYYRAAAKASGTYFPGDADLSHDDAALAGVLFAEGRIRLSGSGITGAATLVAATGDIELSGAHASLTPAVDGLFAFAGAGDVSLAGSGSSYLGAIFAPVGGFSRHGADDAFAPGPIVADTIAWTGARGHVGGQCCITAADCGDGDACTSDVCEAGACRHAAIADCAGCRTDADCNDGNACTTDACAGGQCVLTPVADGTSCADGNACNGSETCLAGSCRPDRVPSCDDADACTEDWCDAQTGCGHTTIADCHACTSRDDCEDGNACTQDTCTGGVCHRQDIADCAPCTMASDCPTPGACFDATCEAGTCQQTRRLSCTPCESDDDCTDDLACTSDVCDRGVCTHEPIPGCDHCEPTESCDNGKDDDCDGLVDCQDPDCAAAPACDGKTEICGDCIDNDGNGLVDFEDPACCAVTRTLKLRAVSLHQPGTPGERLHLGTEYVGTLPASFDPLAQDTSLQISDEHGQVFCTTVNAMHFMKRGKRDVAFWGDGSFANGLTDGRFLTTRSGRVTFRTHGKNAAVHMSDSHSILVTLRVGEQCAQASSKLKSTTTGLVLR